MAPASVTVPKPAPTPQSFGVREVSRAAPIAVAHLDRGDAFAAAAAESFRHAIVDPARERGWCRLAVTKVGMLAEIAVGELADVACELGLEVVEIH